MFNRVEVLRPDIAGSEINLVRHQILAGLALIGLLCLTVYSGRVSAQGPAEASSIKFWNDHEAQSVIRVNHDPWQAMLSKYVDDAHPSGVNRFDYDAVTPVDLQRLKDYLSYLQKLEPRQFNQAEQLAYWINLYNAKIVELVASAYAQNDKINSVREVRSGVFVPGPWKRDSLTIVFQEMSLEDIEHGILRPNFQDFRIHYVLNDASIGCPNLLKTAFRGENNEELLQKAEKDYLTHSRAIRVESGELVLASMFDWYRSDFASDTQGLFDYLRKNAVPELAATLNSNLDIRFEHDWALNKP